MPFQKIKSVEGIDLIRTDIADLTDMEILKANTGPRPFWRPISPSATPWRICR